MTSSNLTTVQPISTQQQVALDNAFEDMLYTGSTRLYSSNEADLICLFEESAKKQGYELSYYYPGGEEYRGLSDTPRVYSIKNLEKFADEDSTNWYIRELENHPVTIYIKKEDRQKNPKPWSEATHHAIRKHFKELGSLVTRETNHDKEPVQGNDYPGTQTFKACSWTFNTKKMDEKESQLWKLWHVI